MKKLFYVFILSIVPLAVDSQNKRTINVVTAGTLSNLISEQEKYQIEELKLTGELNGTDFHLIREMAGIITYINKDDLPRRCNKITNGKLKILDLSDVEIKSGGKAYYYANSEESNEFYDCYTRQNKVTYGIFAYTELESIILPYSITEIHRGAFAFSKLKSLIIRRSSILPWMTTL